MKKVGAIADCRGGCTGHVATIARELGITAVGKTADAPLVGSLLGVLGLPAEIRDPPEREGDPEQGPRHRQGPLSRQRGPPCQPPSAAPHNLVQ